MQSADEAAARPARWRTMAPRPIFRRGIFMRYLAVLLTAGLMSGLAWAATDDTVAPAAPVTVQNPAPVTVQSTTVSYEQPPAFLREVRTSVAFNGGECASMECSHCEEPEPCCCECDIMYDNDW